MFGDKVDELIVHYVKSTDEFYAALQKAMHLIRLEVIAQGNKFAGSFDIWVKFSLFPRLLWLGQALINPVKKLFQLLK